VNPRHLEPVTDRENILRGEGIAAKRSGAKTCRNGHADWIPHRGGDPRYRICRTCEAVRKAKWQRSARLKLKLMAACHGINVELVRRAGKSRGWR